MRNHMRLRLVVVHQEVFSEEAQLGSAGSAFGGVVIAEIPRHQGLCGDTENVSG